MSSTQCKDQTDKVHPCRSPAASGTSQGTHPAIHPTWLQNPAFHLTKDKMSNSKYKDEQTFQELWRGVLSNQQTHSLSHSHLKWELSVSLAPLQAKSVRWSMVPFGLVIWGNSVLSHSSCAVADHTLSARVLFSLVLHSHLSYKLLRLFKKIIRLDFEAFFCVFSLNYNFKYCGILDVFCFSNKQLIVISFIMWKFKNLLWMHSFEFS